MGRIEEVRRRLNAELPRLMTAHEVPGASVAVLVDGQATEATAGVVHLGTGVEATPGALFMIQSISKVWTATLVMQLVDEGLVELDVPVRVFLPGFRTDDDRASADVTVRHLLTHTGGFEGDLWAATTSDEDALQRFVEDLVAGAPQHSRPRELFAYCSAGYGVLGRLVEVLRGMPYARALRRPESGVAIAVLTNGQAGGPLIEELIDPMLGDLAAIPPAPTLSAPDGSARVAEHQRYLGRYQTRPAVHDVTLDEAGRLWLTSASRNEALTMAERAGVPSNPERHELRPAGGDVFRAHRRVRCATSAVEFLGHSATGGARFLHTGRAAPRAS